MRQKSGSSATTSEKVVKDIRRATRKRHSAEEKIRNSPLEPDTLLLKILQAPLWVDLETAVLAVLAR